MNLLMVALDNKVGVKEAKGSNLKVRSNGKSEDREELEDSKRELGKE